MEIEMSELKIEDMDYCDWCGDWLKYCECVPDGGACSQCGKVATLDCRTPHQ